MPMDSKDKTFVWFAALLVGMFVVLGIVTIICDAIKG